MLRRGRSWAFVRMFTNYSGGGSIVNLFSRATQFDFVDSLVLLSVDCFF